MTGDHDVVVVRLGHRPGRDERMTTHVGLTARAFGADGVVLPETAGSATETITDVTDRFGGPFAVIDVPDPESWLDEWTSAVVHLTMYGLPVESTLDEIVDGFRPDPIAIVVGAGKVGGDLYDRATWNVAITNQPHSEVAALAVFLDRFGQSADLDRAWENADRSIIPSESGKRVRRHEG